MPNTIRQLARKILDNPVEIALALSKPVENVDQKAYLVYDEQKTGVLKHLLAERNHYESILIFTSRKDKISDIVFSLNKSGFHAQGISSNLDQDEREEVLGKFRARRIRILVATDVMSRGIDVKEINLVINFDVPQDAEDYVHRIGRTARVNAKGEAITLVTQKEFKKLRIIEQLIESSIPKLMPPEELGHAPKWEEEDHRPVDKRNFHGKKKYYNRGPNKNKSFGKGK
jgi:superfamily II DNA/RNA helicase